MVESAAERQARNLAMLERSVQRHREEEEETLERPGAVFKMKRFFQWEVVVEDLFKQEIMKYKWFKKVMKCNLRVYSWGIC